MKINKEQEVVMKVHKQKGSKIHKKSEGTIIETGNKWKLTKLCADKVNVLLNLSFSA